MAAAMYKGPDICAYYAILGAAKCGEARLAELGVMAFDLSFQVYCIWVVRHDSLKWAMKCDQILTVSGVAIEYLAGTIRCGRVHVRSQ